MISMSTLKLTEVCEDLFQTFETSYVDKEQEVETYFRQLSQKHEMGGALVKPTEYKNLKTIVQSDVMPVYRAYLERKDEILIKKDNRELWKYVVGTVVGANVLEAILTGGRSLRPQIVFFTGLLEAGLGAGIYGATNLADNFKLSMAKRRFFKTVKGIEKKIITGERYDGFQKVMNGDLLKAEAYDVLSRYASPKKFWGDYKRIRKKDPTNKHAVQALKTPAFKKFLNLHSKEIYTSEKREDRFNQLFLLAHEYFMKNDQNYVVNQMGVKK